MIRSGETVLAEGSVEGYAFRTVELNGFRVHDITVIAPINLATRIPLYHQVLQHAAPPNFFCIVDNSAGFENCFTYDDIQLLDRILIDHGIRKFFGATITQDAAYTKLVKLAQANMDEIGLEGAVTDVPDRAAAEAFILQRIDEEAAARNA